MSWYLALLCLAEDTVSGETNLVNITENLLKPELVGSCTFGYSQDAEEMNSGPQNTSLLISLENKLRMFVPACNIIYMSFSEV